MEQTNEINNNVSELSKDQIKIANDKKLIAGICGILLGSLGIHKFYLGYSKEGIIMLLVSLLTCGFGVFVMSIIGLIEGITYLTKSDEEFYKTYIINNKGWF
jgi:TM2 domain-containing membrane protein YozV